MTTINNIYIYIYIFTYIVCLGFIETGARTNFFPEGHLWRWEVTLIHLMQNSHGLKETFEWHFRLE